MDTKEKRRIYHREYRKKNPERIREHQRSYRLRHPEKVKEWKKAYMERHPEKRRAYRKTYKTRHPEKVRAARKRYRRLHPEKFNHRMKILRLKAVNIVAKARTQGRIECECCQENAIEFITLDHINSDGWKEKKSGKRYNYYFYQDVIKNHRVVDIRLLCHNCNQSRIRSGYCPHDI